MEELRELILRFLLGIGFGFDYGHDSNDLNEYLLVKWANTDTERNLWLTVRLYQNKDFINIWIDKLWDGETMGNGFIHKSLYKDLDAYQMFPIILLAIG